MMTRDSTMFSMYPSRLLSWPMYFCYSSTIGATSYGLPRLERYHLAIMLWPSGLMENHRIKIVSCRIASSSGSPSATASWYASWMGNWLVADSVDALVLEEGVGGVAA